MFFSAVAHSLMDEMNYPVLRGRIPAQVKLSLTASNALVSSLNEVSGDIVKASPLSAPHGPGLSCLSCDEFRDYFTQEISSLVPIKQCIWCYRIHDDENINLSTAVLEGCVSYIQHGG